MNQLENIWQFWIDVGGTFTDCVYCRPDRTEGQLKILSSGIIKTECLVVDDGQFQCESLTGYPDSLFDGYQFSLTKNSTLHADGGIVERFSGSQGLIKCKLPATLATGQYQVQLSCNQPAPLLAIRLATETSLAGSIPDLHLNLGTTRGTNALLTRNGARCALATTQGFQDLLQIGDQTRPDLFSLSIKKHLPLYESCIEIEERILHDGTVESALNQQAARTQLAKLKQDGIESLAICLLHGFRNPQHEIILEQLAREIGFKDVSRASQLSTDIKIVPRASTTVLDAYLNPVLNQYLQQIDRSLSPDSQMKVMNSAGALTPSSRFRAKDSILSGPAGGVVGMTATAQQAGFDRVIGFDMGGTSTDVSRFDGKLVLQYESEKAGAKIFSPTVAINTIAAGGGSICQFEGSRLKVGPESAGASPGPACYGNGGPLTITDMNLFLDRISTSHFPFQLDREIVETLLTQQTEAINQQTGASYSTRELAAGYLRIANLQMANAVRSVSLAKGFDSRDYVLVGFGGAAGQHLCAVADELGIQKCLIHPQASLLSAVGIKHARQSCYHSKAILQPLQAINKSDLETFIDQLKQSTTEQLQSETRSDSDIQYRVEIETRYRGTESYLKINYSDQFATEFASEHQLRFGFQMDRELEIGAIRVEAFVERQLQSTSGESGSTEILEIEPGQDLEIERGQLVPGTRITESVRIVDQLSTVVVDHGWQATVLEDYQLLLSRVAPLESPAQTQAAASDQVDPILLEVFNNHLTTIATNMGTTLQRTSCSVNVKERLDFSCAVFNDRGELAVNAPHIPVHLGAMSETVKTIIKLNQPINRDDLFVTNNPFQGGSHLPDITVISPVFISDHQEHPSFYVASRSHHAEVGGIRPGSMPPNARNLEEEGVVLSNIRLDSRSKSMLDELRIRLAGATYPSRSIEENLADITAQIAANQSGRHELIQLVQHFGATTVANYMDWIQLAAYRKVSEAISALPDQQMQFVDHLDNGCRIELSIEKLSPLSSTKMEPLLKFNFDGTSETCPDNHHANRAIVSAAIMYCLRCLIDEDIPLNEGILQAVDLQLGPCFLNPEYTGNDEQAPPMAAGNVETSQRLVDVILGALGIAAASQGTMNNLLIGNDSFGYYETICGGAGATEHSSGAHAVHTHMTNTRLTDPEILESQFPMVLHRFKIREASGGQGRHCGGDGVIREIEFREPLEVSIISNRRGDYRPFGLEGGSPGAVGVNLLIRSNGIQEPLQACCSFSAAPGDRLQLQTPGGGGFGQLQPERNESSSSQARHANRLPANNPLARKTGAKKTGAKKSGAKKSGARKSNKAPR